MIKAQTIKKFTNINHGFSTIEDGDFKRKSYLDISLSEKKIISPIQSHGNNIKIIAGKDSNTKDTDGLVTMEKNVVLSVKTADCLPIVLFDPVCKVIAISHAGWKGTLFNISKSTVMAMEKLGSKPKNIVAALGPHIMSCCYNIDAKRANIIENTFPQMPSIIAKRMGRLFLDLAKFNRCQLLEVGLNIKNLETINLCTYCNNKSFFSYRRQGNKSGRMFNFICLSN